MTCVGPPSFGSTGNINEAGRGVSSPRCFLRVRPCRPPPRSLTSQGQGTRFAAESAYLRANNGKRAPGGGRGQRTLPALPPPPGSWGKVRSFGRKMLFSSRKAFSAANFVPCFPPLPWAWGKVRSFGRKMPFSSRTAFSAANFVPCPPSRGPGDENGFLVANSVSPSPGAWGKVWSLGLRLLFSLRTAFSAPNFVPCTPLPPGAWGKVRSLEFKMLFSPRTAFSAPNFVPPPPGPGARYGFWG